MSESNETKKMAAVETHDPATDGCGCNQTLAFLVLRGWLAVRAILTGVEKFGAYKTIQQPLIDPTTGQPSEVNCVGTKKFALNKIGLALIFTGKSISLIGSAGNESGKRMPVTFFDDEQEIKKNEAMMET